MILTAVIECPGCCDADTTCADRYGETIEGTFTGVLPCEGCYVVGEPGSRNDYRVSFTGLSGVYTLTWEITVPAVSGRWFGTVGTATWDKYSTDDGTCGGDPIDTETSDIILSVVCGLETGIIQPAQAISDSVVLPINFFLNSTETTFGAVRDNELACVEPGDIGIVGAFDGSLELNTV